MPSGEIGRQNLDVQLVRMGDRPVGFKSKVSLDKVHILFQHAVPVLGCVACEEVLVWLQPFWECPNCHYSVGTTEALEIIEATEVSLKALKDVIGRSVGKGRGRWSLARLFGK